jgi:uncharacterized protein involved in exopolysaccharide biosynthesis
VNKDTLKISDLIIPILKYIKVVVGIVFFITIFSLVISLILTKTYKSTSEVIQTNQSVGNFGGILQSIGSLNSGQRKVGGETILVLLNSKSLKDSLIANFDLFERYEEDYKESLYMKMAERFQYEEIREGGLGFNPIVSVKISVIDESPEIAQKMNEYILGYLSERMESINNENSEYTLQLIQQRYRQNQMDLFEAEQALNAFQNQFGIFEMDTQLALIIENIALIKQQIVEVELQRDLFKLNFGVESSQYKLKVSELSVLNESYSGLIEKSNSIDNISFATPNLKDVPDLFLEYARLFREVEIQNTIYEFIVPQLEQQQLYLLNSDSGLRIVDQADLPTYKYKPKRAYVVIAGFIFSILLALSIVLFKEAINNKDSELSKILSSIKSQK